MNLRRSAPALVATVLFGLVAAPVAHADDPPSSTPSPSASHPHGLFGTADPTYDGVFRQSYALLAQHTVGVRPAASAIDWLTGQQCANGGFAAFRADPDRPCTEKTAPDSNSTGAAVQALAALGGHEAAVRKAVSWLASVQNEDGGWGYQKGLPTDVNSTGLVVGALTAADKDPAAQRSDKGKTPFDALVSLTLPCAKGGAFGLRDAKSGALKADADATAAGVLGTVGTGVVVDPDRPAVSQTPRATCQDDDAEARRGATANGAAYLRERLAKTPYLKATLPGVEDQPDYGNTADAAVALAAAGEPAVAKKAVTWLEQHAGDWARKTGPAGYATLIFAAHATGVDPRHFGGTDLVSALNKTGPPPQRATGAADPEDRDDGGDDNTVWWVTGACLVAGVGGGLLLSTRTRRRS